MDKPYLRKLYLCAQCGKPFIKEAPSQKFCSLDCRTNYWDEHSKDRQRYQRDWWSGRNGDSRRVGKIRLPEGERKRHYTGECEVCGKVQDIESKLFDYHHWDDDMPAMGMYLCARCHKVAEGVESGLDTIYKDVRYKIEKEYAAEQLAKIGISLEVLDG